jgi:hypothetical protein
MTRSVDGWAGEIPATGARVEARTRDGCLNELRDAAGDDAILTVEVLPMLAGVAEAAAILGWDRRRVVTYIDRGSFPSPIASLASGRVWIRDDVEAFARAFRRRQARRAARR